ncbi:MAG: hypothetical protein ABWY78_06270 [Microvirga sp.]
MTTTLGRPPVPQVQAPRGIQAPQSPNTQVNAQMPGTAAGAPQAAPQQPGPSNQWGANTGGYDPEAMYRPSGGNNFGYTQPAANPNQQTTDENGDIWQMIPGQRNAFGAQTTQPQWKKIGNKNANQGGGGAGNNDIDFNALWAKTGAIPPPPQVEIPPEVKGPGLEDRRRAESLEFGRAKSRLANIGRGSMKALESQFARRGLSGSGQEGKQLAGVVGGMRGDLSNVATEQALSALAREAQISDRDYAGGINQRGQNIGISTGNADRTAENQRTRVNLLNSLMGYRSRGSRIY